MPTRTLRPDGVAPRGGEATPDPVAVRDDHRRVWSSVDGPFAGHRALAWRAASLRAAGMAPGPGRSGTLRRVAGITAGAPHPTARTPKTRHRTGRPPPARHRAKRYNNVILTKCFT